MRRAILTACLAVSSCAAIPPDQAGFNSCDVVRAGDFDSRFAFSALTQRDVERAVRAALDAATMTTDITLHDTTENCRAMQGYRIYTKATANYDVDMGWGKKERVAGHTLCFGKFAVVGTPDDGIWKRTALVHELFHVMQNCDAPDAPGKDGGVHEDEAHSNWVRDGIFNALDYAESLP